MKIPCPKCDKELEAKEELKNNYRANYEINAIRNCIIGKEKRSVDASYERGLLKSWANYPGYEKAGEVLAKLEKHHAANHHNTPSRPPNAKKRVTKIATNEILLTPPQPIVDGGIMLHEKATTKRPRGRPPKPDGAEVTRMTLYRRRKKERQLAMKF